MSGKVEGLPDLGGAAEGHGAPGIAPGGQVRRPGEVPPPRATPGAAAVPGRAGGGRATAPFDPVAAALEVARGVSGPPAAGLQAQLLDWVAPRARQFEAMQPARLLSLLGMAVDRLAQEAPGLDELGWLGAAALERELRDHQALAERRATMIDP